MLRALPAWALGAGGWAVRQPLLIATVKSTLTKQGGFPQIAGGCLSRGGAVHADAQGGGHGGGHVCARAGVTLGSRREGNVCGGTGSMVRSWCSFKLFKVSEMFRSLALIKHTMAGLRIPRRRFARAMLPDEALEGLAGCAAVVGVGVFGDKGVGKSALIDSFIGRCPFCAAAAERELTEPQVTRADVARQNHAVSGPGDQGHAAAEDYGSYMGSAGGPAAGAGAGAGNDGDGSWGLSQHRQQPKSLMELCRLQIHRNRVPWETRHLPPEVAHYLGGLRSSFCLDCGAVAIKEHRSTPKLCRFTARCRFRATPVGLMIVDSPAWPLLAAGTPAPGNSVPRSSRQDAAENAPAGPSASAGLDDTTALIMRGLEGFVVVLDVGNAQSVLTAKSIVQEIVRAGTVSGPPSPHIVVFANGCCAEGSPAEAIALRAEFERLVVGAGPDATRSADAEIDHASSRKV